MNRTWKFGWIIALLFLGIGSVVLQPWQDAEPRFEGRTVSNWIKEYHPVRSDSGTVTFPAKVALERIGPAAIPYLEEALRTKDSWWRTRYQAWYPKLRKATGGLAPSPRTPAWELRRKAALALGDLRCDQAVPCLVRALDDPHPAVRAQTRLSLLPFSPKLEPVRSELDQFLRDAKHPDLALETVIELRLKTPVAMKVVEAVAEGTNSTLRAEAKQFLANPNSVRSSTAILSAQQSASFLSWTNAQLIQLRSSTQFKPSSADRR